MSEHDKAVTVDTPEFQKALSDWCLGSIKTVEFIAHIDAWHNTDKKQAVATERTAKEITLRNAEVMAQEMRTQRSNVTAILEYFGCPNEDQRALELVKAAHEKAVADAIARTAEDYRKMMAAGENFFSDKELENPLKFALRQPPEGYRDCSVVGRNGQLIFLRDVDRRPTDGHVFYDGDYSDVLTPYDSRVQPPIQLAKPADKMQSYLDARQELDAAIDNHYGQRGDGDLPPLPDHPEAQVMQWSELERRAIEAYGRRCLATRQSAPVADHTLPGEFSSAEELFDAMGVSAPVAAAVAQEGWKDRLYAAMDAEFALRDSNARDPFDGQKLGMHKDDTQEGVEFAMRWFEQNMLAAAPQPPADAAPVDAKPVAAGEMIRIYDFEAMLTNYRVCTSEKQTEFRQTILRAVQNLMDDADQARQQGRAAGMEYAAKACDAMFDSKCAEVAAAIRALNKTGEP